MTDTENLLITRSQKGDIAAFEELIKEHKKIAYNIALRILRNNEDAEDISQESLIKVFKSIGSFNMQSSFKTWLYRIVVNTCLDFKRKNKEKVISIDKPLHSGHEEFYVEIEDTEPTPEEIVEKKYTQKMMLSAINQLEDDYRDIIILRDLNNFSYEEISEVLSCNLGTVKSRISRGRQKLKDIVIKNIEDYN